MAEWETILEQKDGNKGWINYDAGFEIGKIYRIWFNLAKKDAPLIPLEFEWRGESGRFHYYVGWMQEVNNIRMYILKDGIRFVYKLTADHKQIQNLIRLERRID